MEANISLEKDRLKLKGKFKRVIIPLEPREGKPWDDIDEHDVDV